MSRDIQNRLAVVASELNDIRANKATDFAKNQYNKLAELIKRNPKKSAALLAAGTAAGGYYAGRRKNRVNAMEIVADGEAGIFKKAGDSLKSAGNYIKGKGAAGYNWIKANPWKAGGGLAAGLAAGYVGNKLLRNRRNDVSAMEYFENITAAEYLEDLTGGNLGFSVSASDYNDLMNISAMEYIIAEDEVASGLTDLSADAAADVTDAETPEEFAEAVQNNQELADAHADAAEINADTAAREDSPEAAALAEYHAGLADEHEDLANDVISALYYE